MYTQLVKYSLGIFLAQISIHRIAVRIWHTWLYCSNCFSAYFWKLKKVHSRLRTFFSMKMVCTRFVHFSFHLGEVKMVLSSRIYLAWFQRSTYWLLQRYGFRSTLFQRTHHGSSGLADRKLCTLPNECVWRFRMPSIILSTEKLLWIVR